MYRGNEAEGGDRPHAGSRGSPGSAACPHTAFNGADGPRRDSHTGVSHRAGPGRRGGGGGRPPRPAPPPGLPPAYGAPRSGGLAFRPANGSVNLPPALERLPPPPHLRPNESSEDTAAKCWGGLEGLPPREAGATPWPAAGGQPVLRIGLMGGPVCPITKGAGDGGGGGGKRRRRAVSRPLLER